MIVRVGPERLPPALRGTGHGLELVITGGEAAAARPEPAAYVAAQMKRGIAVFLSVRSPATLVNDRLAADADAARVQSVLVELYRLAHAARWERGLGMLLPLYRLQVGQMRARLARNA